MPVNSFDNYPMNWKPDKKMLKFPMYLSLADLLEQDIISCHTIERSCLMVSF